MSFLSVSFLVFVSVVLVTYYAFPRHQNKILLAANTIFLASWSWKSFFILAAISNAIYFGLKSADFRPGKKRTFLLIAPPTFVLLVFKLLQARTPVQVDEMTDLIIPLGLSYYVFQLSGYVIDCYRGEATAPFSWIRFANFSSFFPQLMMGPIERYSTMQDQFVNGAILDFERFVSGLYRISLGALKKLTLADPLFPVFRLAFQDPQALSAAELVLYCGVGFFQIYFDFSAYADIAVGLGRLFGIRLTENFRQPYLAHSISDIWQRWHFSLVRWVRSYVFLPLFLKTRSLLFCTLVTFIAVGMWHQLNLNFLFWAFYWFALFYAETLFRKFQPARKTPLWLARIGSFVGMALASLFFAEGSIREIGDAFLRILEFSNATTGTSWARASLSRLDAIGLMVCFGLAILQDFIEFDDRFRRLRTTGALLVFTLVAVFCATLFAKDLPRPFIYLMF